MLADALYYAATRFKPRCIIDLATLTYAVSAALGGAAGFQRNDRLARISFNPVRLLATFLAIADGRLLRRISDFADRGLPASRHRRRAADATHAAALLKHFVDGRDWAHLDIANRFAHKDRALCPVGGTGFGVALLEQFAAKVEGIS